MWNNPIVISDGNLSRAWARTFLRVMAPPSTGNTSPIALSITEFDALGEPVEMPEIRDALDATILQINEARDEGDARVQSVSGTAQTIFPHMCWSPRSKRPAEELFAHYHTNVLPRLKTRCTPNRHGTYFARMTGVTGCGTGGETKFVNQLGDILKWWNEHKSRPLNSSMQVSIYDPSKDHTGSARKGFPCLQQVSFRRDGEVLSLCAYYPTEYILGRGYGNYLGLCHLLNFMASEMGLALGAMCVFVLQPILDGNKLGPLKDLETTLKGLLPVEQPTSSSSAETSTP